MQDGYIFADTMAQNISCSPEKVDISRLNGALQICNLSEFVQSLPLGTHETRIGDEGVGISGVNANASYLPVPFIKIQVVPLPG